MSYRPLSQLVAAGTALSNSTTETILASYNMPGNSLQSGKRYKISGAVVASSTNSTDTLRVRLRVGPTTLTGTVILDGTAVDVANNDVIVFDISAQVRADGVVIFSGFATLEGAEGTVTARAVFESVTVADVTATLRIELTGLWSVASASNSCRADAFDVDEIV